MTDTPAPLLPEYLAKAIDRLVAAADEYGHTCGLGVDDALAKNLAAARLQLELSIAHLVTMNAAYRNAAEECLAMAKRAWPEVSL